MIASWLSGRHQRLLVSRLGFQLIPTLFVVSLLAFTLVRLSPIDAASVLSGRGATVEEIHQVRVRLGLDESAPRQYFTWIAHAARGDLGSSLFVQKSVFSLILSSIGATIALISGALALASLIGIPLGIVSALRPHSWADRTITGVTSLGVALPEFVLAILFVTWFAVELNWLPAVGYISPGESVSGWLRHLILPWAALAVAPAAEVTRQTRGAFRDALEQDYVLSARAKGLPARIVVGKHVFKNAAGTIITIIGLWFGRLIGGAVLVEYVFAIPGFGLLTINAVQRHDYPVIQGVVICSAVVVLVTNLAVDIVHSYVNPKIAAVS
jgi:peptide/nickel transport system permease protein